MRKVFCCFLGFLLSAFLYANPKDASVLLKELETYSNNYEGKYWGKFCISGNSSLLEHIDELSTELKEKINLIVIDNATHIPDLSSFTNVHRLQISSNSKGYLVDVTGLANLKVNRLELTNNKITDLSPIGKNQFVKELVLQWSFELESLPNMEKMTNLRKLDLRNCNKLTTLKNIDTIPGPVDVYIFESNNIKDFSALLNCKIRNLYIDGGDKNSIGGLKKYQCAYDLNKEWFDKNLPIIKKNNPDFTLRFQYDNSEL